MDTTIEHPVPDRLSAVICIFDTRALWRSGLSVRVSGCQTLQRRLNPVWHRMLYSCTHMTSVALFSTRRWWYYTMNLNRDWQVRCDCDMTRQNYTSTYQFVTSCMRFTCWFGRGCRIRSVQTFTIAACTISGGGSSGMKPCRASRRSVMELRLSSGPKLFCRRHENHIGSTTVRTSRRCFTTWCRTTTHRWRCFHAKADDLLVQ